MSQQYYKGKDGNFYPVQNNQFGHSGNNFNAAARNRKKHSGAKFTKYFNSKNEEQFLTTGWRLSKNKELLAYKAVTTKFSKLSEKGWFGSVYVTITNKVTGEINSLWGTMQKSTGKVVIDSIQVVMNPRAKNGGYTGTYLNN